MDTTKRLLVSFLVIASLLVTTGFAAAASPQIVTLNSVQVNGLETLNTTNSTFYNVSVLAGQTIPVTVAFTANSNQSNVRLSLELQGATTDVSNEILVGDVEANQTYIRTVSLTVPESMSDVQSDNINLVLNVWSGNSSVAQTSQTITLREQRQTYDAQVMSLNTLGSVKAGNLLPVNVVVKNVGYNQLNDLYVTVSLPALGVQRTAYFGDIAKAVSGNDTASGTIYLQVPYNASAGTYSVQADVKNSQFSGSATTTVSVTNQFQNNALVSNSQMSTNVGANAVYSLTIVNPTNSIALYNIVPANDSGVKISSDSVVAVPAGSSKTVPVTVSATSAGTHNFSLNVLSGSELTGQVALTLSASNGISNPVAILTIVLAVVFAVLLVVLIVLVTKKPKKQEEFGESYY